jgi:hypothetical protein
MSAFAGSACWRQTAQARVSDSLRAFSEAATMAWVNKTRRSFGAFEGVTASRRTACGWRRARQPHET